MYTDKKNILQLVALLEAHGITKVVLCPGSRNTPIVHTLSNHPNFTCYCLLYTSPSLSLVGSEMCIRDRLCSDG